MTQNYLYCITSNIYATDIVFCTQINFGSVKGIISFFGGRGGGGGGERALNISRRASYEITLSVLLGHPSVHWSICPSLNFLKTVSLVFSDIVHGDS